MLAHAKSTAAVMPRPRLSLGFCSRPGHDFRHGIHPNAGFGLTRPSCLRQRRRERGGVLSVPSAKGKTQGVVEHLLLMRFDPETTKQDKAKSSIENVWSLQYRVGGVICSSAGKSDQEKVKNGLEATRLDVQLLKQVGYYTHGVHFRFPSKAQLDSFLESPVVQKMQEDELRPDRCPGTAVVSFESSLPEDLFAIFRKGQDWDEGYDHLLVVECKESRDASSTIEEMQKFLEEYRPNMEEFGLQQVTFGKALNNDKQLGMLMRFRNEFDFEAYTKSLYYTAFVDCIRSAVSLSIVTYPMGSQKSGTL